MKNKFIKLFLLNILMLFFILLTTGCKKSANRSNNKIGGECIYKTYSGIAEINDIFKSKESSMQALVDNGPGYEGYEIKFSVRVNEEINKDWAKDSIKKEQLFLLANSWYPGIKYINKYNIKTGNKYSCKVKIIEKGSCTPIIFDFNDLNIKDYFELKQ